MIEFTAAPPLWRRGYPGGGPAGRQDPNRVIMDAWGAHEI